MFVSSRTQLCLRRLHAQSVPHHVYRLAAWSGPVLLGCLVLLTNCDATASDTTLVGHADGSAARKSERRFAGFLQEWEDDTRRGTFDIAPLDTRVKIDGFVQLNAIFDTNQIATRGQFVTATIPTNTPSKSQQSLSIQPTRLRVESTTPLPGKRLTMFASGDLYGNAVDLQPEPRFRQAYVQLTDAIFGGDLMIGQAWSTLADLHADPDVLDYQGPNSFYGGLRQPMVRWNRAVGRDLHILLAAETADNHVVSNATLETRLPDGMLSAIWDRSTARFTASAVIRDLRASRGASATETARGWGIGVSGRILLPTIYKNENFTFSVAYGSGIGSLFNDAPPDAVFDTASNSLETIPMLGYYMSYQHWWAPRLSSTVVYGRLDANNRTAQAPGAFDHTQYAAANLVWTPDRFWIIGIEGLWGRRVDKDGVDGSDFRTQITIQRNF